MSLAAFIADHRTSYRVPYRVACQALGVSESWFYKWRHRSRVHSPVQVRRAEIDAAVAEAFAAARGVHAAGWVVQWRRRSRW